MLMFCKNIHCSSYLQSTTHRGNRFTAMPLVLFNSKLRFPIGESLVCEKDAFSPLLSKYNYDSTILEEDCQ